MSLGIGLVLLWGACPGEGNGTSQDSFNPSNYDGGQQDGQTQQDQGENSGDQGSGTPHGDLDCLDLMSCVADCATDECIDDCMAQGTLPAQDQLVTLAECTSDARMVTCVAPCGQDDHSDECYNCVDQACAEDLHYCMFGSVALDGFGQLCDQEQLDCPDPLICMSQNSNQGFCTYPCTEGELCRGAPLGTYAQCVYPSISLDVCGFLCQFNNKHFDCPDQLVCSPTEAEPGTGMYFCVPGAS